MKLHEVNFEIGDYIYLLSARNKTGVSKKLQPIFTGPFVISKVFSDVLYEIAGQKKNQIVHHDRMFVCKDNNIPLWLSRKRGKILREFNPNENEIPIEEPADNFLDNDLMIDDLFEHNEQEQTEDEDSDPETEMAPATNSSSESDNSTSSEEEEALPVARSSRGRILKRNPKYSKNSDG